MTRSTLEQALGFDIPLIVPIMLILYIAVIMVVGLWAAKKVKNSEDWFVGGRSMGPWITALAHGSSSLGGGMYIAGPQYGWEAGASSLWAAPGDVFGPILNFGIIARRMRKYTEKARALTIPEFFGHRYNSTGVRYLAVIILIIAMIISLLVEFMAMGVLVACITGLNYTVSLILGAIAILIYTGAGGYLSVAYTDFVQSILMIIGLFILIPVCIHNVGGLSGMNTGLININEGLATLWGEDYYLKGAPLMIAGIALVYFIGYMGQPHLIIKTVAIKDEKSIKLVPMIGAAFGFVLSFGVYILGMVGRVAYPDISMLPGGSAEYIMPMMALSNLPPVLSGLILAGATAAIMSTASALLLVIGSSVGNDLLTMIHPEASEDHKMKNATKGGAIAAMLVGSVTGFGWYYLLQEITNIHTFFAALVLATAAYIIVSKLTKKPPQEVLDLFYYAKSFDPADADSEAVSPAKAASESSDGTKTSTVSAGIRMSADQFRAVLENA